MLRHWFGFLALLFLFPCGASVCANARYRHETRPSCRPGSRLDPGRAGHHYQQSDWLTAHRADGCLGRLLPCRFAHHRDLHPHGAQGEFRERRVGRPVANRRKHRRSEPSTQRLGGTDESDGHWHGRPSKDGQPQLGDLLSEQHRAGDTSAEPAHYYDQRDRFGQPLAGITNQLPARQLQFLAKLTI
jgi:hypothetical protein